MTVDYSLNKLYAAIGISKQAVSQYRKRQEAFDANLLQLVTEADELRSQHPGCGVEKMYHTLRPDFIGRDRFIETMMQLGYRLQKKKNYKRTTISGKVHYPNLIKGMVVDGPNTIWQSDITYIPLGNRHYYAVFIIDVYTKEIVGYSITDHMRATANVKALKMALGKHPPPRLHHSDRGSQYTYKGYVKILQDNGVAISMATSAQDNAYAERINRTIKEEYLDYWRPNTFHKLRRDIKRAVDNYNTKRVHNNINRMTPKGFSENYCSFTGKGTNTITIFNNECLT